MKKDYITVSAADALLSETAFGEAQWTRIWDSYDLPDSAASGIEKREEVQNIDLGTLFLTSSRFANATQWSTGESPELLED